LVWKKGDFILPLFCLHYSHFLRYRFYPIS
jgi:hypothetical protein